MISKYSLLWLFVILNSVVFFGTDTALAVSKSGIKEGSVMIDTLHLILETTSILLLLKIALAAGKFVQWKNDHDISNIRDFKNVHRRINDVKTDIQEVRLKM